MNNQEIKTYYFIEPLFDEVYKVRTKKSYSNLKDSKYYFSTEKQAINNFLKVQKRAIKKYNDISKGIEKLRKELDIDFYFDYFYEGDIYGIETEGKYIVFGLENYEFKFLL